MRALRSLAAVVALPLMAGGFSYNPLVTEHYPGGITLVRSLACPVGIQRTQLYTNPIMANTTYNDAGWYIYSMGAQITTTVNPSTSTGNVTITQTYGTGFIPNWVDPNSPTTIDVDIVFSTGSANASNSVTMNLSAACGAIQLTQNLSIN